MAVDWRIKSFIDIFSSVVAPAGASRATLARRWNEIRILPLFSTLQAVSGLLIRKDLENISKGDLWTFDTELRHCDPGAARRLGQ